MEKNVDGSLRKPRRTKGTPFYSQRNYYSLAVLGLGGVCWLLYELWPQTRKLRQNIREGKFDPPKEVEEHFLRARLALTSGAYDHLLPKLDARQRAKEDAEYIDESKPKPCSPKLEKISKYFQKLPKEDSIGNCNNSLDESPYKNCLTEIKPTIQNDSSADADDFKASEPCKVSKLIETKLKREPTRKRKKYKQTKLKLENFTDTNPDHLQLALALSESSYTAETSSQSNDSTCSTKSQEKIEAFKKALEKFGFQSTRTNKLQVEIKRTSTEIRKPSKKSRYRYVTPVLFIRTEEERQTLISTKINEILANNQTIDDLNYRVDNGELFNENLQKIHNKDSKYFRLNSLNLEEMQLEKFYTKNLRLSPQKGQWGSLLKDWRDIAGRDRSPSPATIAEKTENFEFGRSSSPDLFESDISKNEEDLCQIDKLKCSPAERLSVPENLEVIQNGELTEQQNEIDDNCNNSYNFTCISDSVLSTENDKVNDRNLTEDLNITEYVNNILTQNNESANDQIDLTEESDENLTNSQDSIVISDDELNYSSIYSTPFKKQQQDEQILNDLQAKYKDKQALSCNNTDLLNDSLNDVLVNVSLSESLKENHVEQITPIRDSVKNDCVIKTENVTPMANYDQMNTPKIVGELQKFGLKPLKRQRGVQMLKYIYDSTHPVIESNNTSGDDDLEGSCSKRRRIHFDELQQINIVGDIVTHSELENDELIFERNRSKKIASCPVPLQIVWYNFLVNNPQIRRNILLYEPLQLEVLHAMLKQQGFKFHIQDLITFFDRKCITIQTNQSNGKKSY